MVIKRIVDALDQSPQPIIAADRSTTISIIYGKRLGINILHSIHPCTAQWAVVPVRRHDVRLTRLRIGHTRLTRKHLLLGESPCSRGSRVVWYRTVACFVTGSSPVPLKTRRVGQRCTLNLSRAETSSRWCGVVVRREGCQLRCRVHVT
ncbi:uncharacterized protein TNCV_1702031 [Trichonephila clavipes]|nr:uncharacterized protein TNCV_1702031 [Trichonephila clavipes]